MGHWRATGIALVVAVSLAACSSGDDNGSADSTSAQTATTVPTSAAATTTVATTATSAAPTTPASSTTARAPTVDTTAPKPTTTLDESSSGGPSLAKACDLLASAQIESVLGGPVSAPTDLETSCEWTIGDTAAGVSDTLTLSLEGTADGLADTRDLLGEDGVDVAQAGEGGVYWADFTTLYFTKDGRLLSLQFLAPEADDPLSGLVALANLVA